ncbi:hypothetical protein [Isoptericola aurantiacus]|uniref:hypothetical protein n=1 Tax=Isoptericola aurantiacus TaxID=3377839 RepID=UPI00383A0B47
MRTEYRTNTDLAFHAIAGIVLCTVGLGAMTFTIVDGIVSLSKPDTGGLVIGGLLIAGGLVFGLMALHRFLVLHQEQTDHLADAVEHVRRIAV